MDLNLAGKRAVVCGSTQGIGKASAIALARSGASITLVARSEEKLQQVRGELPSSAGQAHDFISADFFDPGLLKKKIEVYASTSQVDILVNNTGGPPAGPALDATLEEFSRAINAHLFCNHVLVQALVPSMKRKGFGRIINIISTSVKIPIRGLGVSNTVRGAVASWSKTLSVELAPFGITVNNVLPGATMTGRLDSIIRNKSEKTGRPFEEVEAEMIAEVPAGRIAAPEEVAAAVAFLASPAAGYVNGINLPVDGGRTGSL